MTPTLLGLALLLTGCNKDAPAPETQPALVCDQPSPLQMRRLTRDQYANTVWAAVDWLGGPPLTVELAEPLAFALTAVPRDVDEGTLSREDQAVSQLHADAWYAVAEVVADGAAEPAMAGEVFGCDQPSCVTEVVDRVVPRLHRRPISDEERAFYVDEVYGAAPTHADGLRDLLLVAMASPYFAHQIEHGDGSQTGDVVRLTAHELASRLSYHFWSAPPDDGLWALAEDGSLTEPAVYEAEVERVFADPRTEQTLEHFFSEWLEVEKLAPMNELVGDPRFDAFRGDFLPSAQLTADMERDALDLIRWHVAHDGTLDDVWTSDLNVATSAELASIYGSGVWDGVSEPEPLDDGVHAGLLTRPAFTASGLTSTRPIHKGVLIRQRVLCDKLGQPPADLGPEPEIDPLSSTRERTEALTEIPGSACYGCHEYINGLGFVTENFDGLGRHRTVEPIYSEDGDELGIATVETQAVSQVVLHDERVVSDGVELARLLAESGRPEACMARYWFRHTYGHPEDEEADACTLQTVAGVLDQGRPLADGLKAIALDPAFQLRTLDNGGAE